jgi:transcriptional regulator with XRE-family HTH domain
MDKRVGERIRAFREKQNLTLADLAGRTGLDESFLSAVETEDLYPSLGPLLKIARALGVRLGTFLDDHVSRDPLIVLLGERKEEFSMHQDGGTPASHTYFSPGQGQDRPHMSPSSIVMNPSRPRKRRFRPTRARSSSCGLRRDQPHLTAGRPPCSALATASTTTPWCRTTSPPRATWPASIYAVLYFPE